MQSTLSLHDLTPTECEVKCSCECDLLVNIAAVNLVTMAARVVIQRAFGGLWYNNCMVERKLYLLLLLQQYHSNPKLCMLSRQVMYSLVSLVQLLRLSRHTTGLLVSVADAQNLMLSVDECCTKICLLQFASVLARKSPVTYVYV